MAFEGLTAGSGAGTVLVVTSVREAEISVQVGITGRSTATAAYYALIPRVRLNVRLYCRQYVQSYFEVTSYYVGLEYTGFHGLATITTASVKSVESIGSDYTADSF